jgi:hypothetical protein
MKRIFIISLLALFTFGCLSTTIPTATQLSPVPSKQPESTVPVIPTETRPSLTAKPTKTPAPTDLPIEKTPGVYEQVQTSIKGENASEITSLLDTFSKARIITLTDYSLEGAATTSLFHISAGISPVEFFTISDVSWEHPTTNIRESSAGCGYLFNDNEKDQSYFTILTLDNQARLTQVRGNYWDGVKHVKDNSMNLSSPNGKVQLILILVDKRVVFAVDGKIMIDQTVDWQSTGSFGYALLSGTNKDYGTRCNYSNTFVFINK